MNLAKAFLLLTAAAAPALAVGPGAQGTSGAQFLKIAPGARAAAMGEAAAAACEDAYAIYYNPAALGTLTEVRLAAMHNSHFQGIQNNFGALAVPVLSWTDSKLARNAYGVAAFSLTSLSVGTIERRGVVETDDPSDTFGASDFAYALGYGLSLSKELAVGASAKVIDQTLDSTHASALAADAGLLYRRGSLSLGGGFRNLGTSVRFANASDPLPFSIYSGLAARLSPAWLLAADLRAPRDHRLGLSLGAEYRKPLPEGFTAALRGGYNSSNTDAEGLTGVSFGAGLAYGQFDFDFAWVPFGDLGNTFKYSLQVRF